MRIERVYRDLNRCEISTISVQKFTLTRRPFFLAKEEKLCGSNPAKADTAYQSIYSFLRRSCKSESFAASREFRIKICSFLLEAHICYFLAGKILLSCGVFPSELSFGGQEEKETGNVSSVVPFPRGGSEQRIEQKEQGMVRDGKGWEGRASWLVG